MESGAPLNQDELPGDAQERAQSAVSLMDNGKSQEALQIWKDLLAQYPHHATLIFELALTYRMVERPLDAAATLQPYESQLDTQGLASLASAYDEGGQTDRALKVLERSIQKFPKSGVLFSTRGTCQANSGQIDQALQSYSQGIEVEPTWPSNYYQRCARLAGTDISALSLIDGETYRNLEPSSSRSEKSPCSWLKFSSSE